MKRKEQLLATFGASGLVTSFLLLVLPYYILGREAYIPKSNPDMGYFMPKSSEAWSILIHALCLLVMSMIAIVFAMRNQRDSYRTTSK